MSAVTYHFSKFIYHDMEKGVLLDLQFQRTANHRIHQVAYRKIFSRQMAVDLNICIQHLKINLHKVSVVLGSYTPHPIVDLVIQFLENSYECSNIQRSQGEVNPDWGSL